MGVDEDYANDIIIKEADSLPNPQRLYDGSKTASRNSISQN